MDELKFPPGALQGLDDLLEQRITSAGINYACGCSKAYWYKDKVLIDEYSQRCEAHADSDGWPPEIGQEHPPS